MRSGAGVAVYLAAWVLVGTFFVASVYFADAAESWAGEGRQLSGFAYTYTLALVLGLPIQIVAALCVRAMTRVARDAVVYWIAFAAALGLALPWVFARAGYVLEGTRFPPEWQGAKSALMFPLMGAMMYDVQPVWVTLAVGAATGGTMRLMLAAARRRGRARTRSHACVAFVLASMTGSTLVAQSSEPTIGLGRPAERLFIAVFSFGDEINELVEGETKRLLDICGHYDSSCFSRYFSPRRVMVSRFHAEPNPASPVNGRVHAVIDVSGEQHGGLRVGLEIERADAPGRFHAWMNSVGDWHYGIYVSGVRPRGKWVQLAGPPFPSAAWVSTEQKSFAASVLPLAGEILALHSVRALFPDRTRRRVPAGPYLITDVSGSHVEFRAEVPSDMACGEALQPPAVMPPKLRAAPAEFFDEDGSPRFSYVYQKGC